jgi:hypothetical protein
VDRVMRGGWRLVQGGIEAEACVREEVWWGEKAQQVKQAWPTKQRGQRASELGQMPGMRRC